MAELLKVNQVTKRFPGVLALDKVDFSLEEGETHALVGANGAGKSTLIKTLAGVYRPDEGWIELSGERQNFKSPNDAMEKGIGVIYQEFTLFSDLDVAKNIYFGREPKYTGTNLIDWKKVYHDAEELLKKFNLELNPYEKVRELSVAQQQMVEIAKALSSQTRILIMDEPTAALTVQEVEQLFTIIEDLKSRGVSIIYISHRLDEVTRISDRLTVLRNGRTEGTAVTGEISREEIIRRMVGENIDNRVKENSVIKSEKVLEVEKLSNEHVHDISFFLQKGEVLGIAGLVGAGRTECVRAVFGADPITAGTIKIHGKECMIHSPKDGIEHGIGLLPESRKEQGLFMNLNIRRNITIVNLKKFLSGFLISFSRESEEAENQIKNLRIKTPTAEFPVLNLSGGNQQKVVLGKWLCANCDILVLDEPTRGVDVGAKEEIFQAVRKLTESGKSVIFISSELEEVLRVSNRILTMYKGRITAEFEQRSVTLNTIMEYITGGQ